MLVNDLAKIRVPEQVVINDQSAIVHPIKFHLTA
jgi:hypothetical protein